MKIYNYNPIDCSYICESIADADPMNDGVWLIPAYATDVAIGADKAFFKQIFDPAEQVWSYVVDESTRPSPAHEWDKATQKWVLNKTKQAELSAQAEQQAVDAVKHALQAHIDSVAVGLGFSGGNAVMLYAGFANAFQSLAQAFGAWEADIWAAANKYMAQVQAGDAPMLTPTQAVERIPKFEFTGA